MDLIIIEIENIYKNYGFEIKKDDQEILSFLYKKGRYFGVDIIPLNDSCEVKDRIERSKESYSRLGYAVNIKKFLTVDELEKELFKSFFSFNSTIGRLKKKYTDFVAKQTKNLLNNQYVYIETPYELYDGESDNDGGLIDSVDGIISKSGPQLVIIEAAAGYGKTCAAFEILRKLISGDGKSVAPLFTELSKNRSAKIFRYILLDEIDGEFSTLNSELVIHEIKNGRIPVIIDGFDELLDKVNVSNVDMSKAFDEIETMLDTIGNLLERNSKVILTTRKTAIFSGAEFDKWFQKWNNQFEVSRFLLKEPRIKDWLGEVKFKIVKDNNMPIQYISNPVILTYLKNTPDDIFKSQIENPEVLVQQYFDTMLERERERQNLIIKADKQYEIFKNVARMLLDFDITVESKNFFKEIIKDQNFKLLEYTRSLYSGQNKPTLESLVDTLATHALLDRKGREESQIGFINDFVLGILIGEIICESSIEKIEKDYSYYMLDLACTAYKVQNRKNKYSLWEKVNSVRNKLQPISIFNYDITLREGLVRDYDNLSIWDSSYFNIDFKGYTISNSIFLNCFFKNCVFDISILKGISFVECTFDNCSVLSGEYLDSSKEISTIKTKLLDCYIIENYNYPPKDEKKIFNDLEIEILKTIWTMSEAKSHHIVQILNIFNNISSKTIVYTLNELEEHEYIYIRNKHVSFNINKLPIIKLALGV